MAQTRKQAVLFLVMLFTSSWLCVLDDRGSHAHARNGHGAGAAAAPAVSADDR